MFNLNRGVVITLCIGFLVLGGSGHFSQTLAQGGGVNLVYDQFDPLVIPVDRVDPVRYQVKVSGRPSRVVLQLETASGSRDLNMQDNGTHGDQLAGDGVYTTLIPAKDITGRLQENDVYRPFVGFVALFEGQTQALRGNVFAEVITDDIFRPAITQLAPDVQATDYLVNIADARLANSLERGALELPTQRFYEIFSDDYDFLNVISSRSFFQNRFHLAVKNDVFGIGQDLFDNSAVYHSDGRLMGITMFPKTNFFDGAQASYQHELAHQWIMFVDAPPFSQGIPHWPLSSMASGTMGWSNPFNGQGQEFPCVLVAQGDQVRLLPRNEPLAFNDMDLYLMGLLPPEQVAPQFVLADQDADHAFAQCDGRVYEGELIPVGAQDIVNAKGPRFPPAQSAPHRFKIATVIVSPQGLLSEEAMALYSFFAQRAELRQEVQFSEGFSQGIAKPFFLSTRELGSLDACMHDAC